MALFEVVIKPDQSWLWLQLKNSTARTRFGALPTAASRDSLFGCESSLLD
jgi:hypothetical protein